MDISRPDEALVTWIFEGTNLPSGPGMVTMGLWSSSTFPALASADATHFYNAWADTVLDNQSVTVTLVGCRITSAAQVVEVAGSSAGSITGGAEPPQTSVLVRKVTGRRGRKHAGRFYIPGLGDGTADNAGMLSFPGAWQEAVDSLYAAITAWEKDGIAAVLHTDKNEVPTPIDSFEVQPQVATQRRRLR